MFARPLATIAYILAVIVCTTIALTPPVLLFPQAETDDLRIALVFLICVGLLLIAWRRPATRREILAWVGLGAAVTLASFVIVRATPPDILLKLPAPSILPRLLHVDGELADDTFLYELVNEMWLALAVVFAAARVLLRRKTASSGSP